MVRSPLGYSWGTLRLKLFAPVITIRWTLNPAHNTHSCLALFDRRCIASVPPHGSCSTHRILSALGIQTPQILSPSTDPPGTPRFMAQEHTLWVTSQGKCSASTW